MIVFKYDRGMTCYVVSDYSLKYGLTNDEGKAYVEARKLVKLCPAALDLSLIAHRATLNTKGV